MRPKTGDGWAMDGMSNERPKIASTMGGNWMRWDAVKAAAKGRRRRGGGSGNIVFGDCHAGNWIIIWLQIEIAFSSHGY